jgi:hypothetical protein
LLSSFKKSVPLALPVSLLPITLRIRHWQSQRHTQPSMFHRRLPSALSFNPREFDEVRDDARTGSASPGPQR